MRHGAWRRRAASAARAARLLARRCAPATTMRLPRRTARRSPRSAAKSPPPSNSHHRLAVELQLLDRLEDVGHRLVLAFLGKAFHELGLPAARELLERRDVEVAVMEVGLELRHPAGEETTVLADRVAAHRRIAGGDVLPE